MELTKLNMLTYSSCLSRQPPNWTHKTLIDNVKKYNEYISIMFLHDEDVFDTIEYLVVINTIKGYSEDEKHTKLLKSIHIKQSPALQH